MAWHGDGVVRGTTLRHNLAFWGLFPFALPQALWVRQTALRFAPAAGPAAGRLGDGPSLKLLAAGDSIIAGVGAARVERALVWQTSAALARRLGCGIQWNANGLIGARSDSLLERYRAVAGAEPADVVLLSSGVNDITSLTSQADWRSNLRSVFSGVVAHSPRAVIAVAGIPPLGAFPLLPQPLKAAAGQRGMAFDSVLRDVASEFPRVLHVPVAFPADPTRFSPDGFHPSEDSYAGFAAVFAERIARELQPSGVPPSPKRPS